VTARDWRRQPGQAVVSLDPEHPEVTLRTPPGEMAGMNDQELGQLIRALHQARVELRARQ
jgi:hypothetical protein